VVSSPAEGNIFPLPPRARPLPFGTHFVLLYIRRIMCGCAWGIWKECFEFYLVSSLVFDQARLHFNPHSDMFASGLVDQDVVPKCLEDLSLGKVRSSRMVPSGD